ncbi:MAG: hypothetical protein V1652_04360 [bacterium]
MKKVMIFGSFGGTEESYSALLDEARHHGNYLIVVIPQDSLVEHLTGKLPTIDFAERFDNLKKNSGVNEIIIDNVDTSIREIIEEKKPDVLAFGSDQEVLKEAIEEIVESLGEPIEVKVLKNFESNT